MIGVDEALARLAAMFPPLPAELVGLDEAADRVLATDVAARLTHPPHDVSAMDGYAVRAADVAQVPASLRVVGESAAGSRFSGTLGSGEAVRIFTGAHLPAGADTIVIQEHTVVSGAVVRIETAAAAGRHIRSVGIDFAAGDVLLHANQRLSWRDVGLAAAMNVAFLPLRRRPRVAVLATGDELRLPGDAVGAEQIVSSASFMITALVRRLGGLGTLLPIARDDERALEAGIATARGSDLLVTIGGASVGDRDLVGGLVRDGRIEVAFSKVAMRPGKPVLCGRLDGVPVLGLPGNPASAGVTAVLFLRAAMQAMLGQDGRVPTLPARLGRPLPANDQRQDYVRAALSGAAGGDVLATPFAQQDSSLLSVLSQAQALIVRAPHAPAASEGDRVEIISLDALDATPGAGKRVAGTA